MLERNIGKIASLSKNLLSFSKGSAPQVKMVKPAELVRQVVELYQEAARREGIELRAELAAEPAPAPMDPEGIHECLANLVANAIDACQMSEKPRCEIVLRCREEADNLIYEVEDKGCGMDYEVKQKVFTNFFTTKGERGTGLGLLLTRKIVQEHGGKISFESVPGEGSLFKIIFPRRRLPRVENESAARLSAEESANVNPAR
jgi:signal transduction histidine kinase